MRIISKLISFLFAILFITSVAFNIIFCVSSSNILMFTNNEQARKRLHQFATDYISDGNYFTIISQNVIETNRSIDQITCGLDEKVSEGLSCKMHSKLYDSESNLLRTSYFPGDGYKYTLENDVGTKSEYSNSNLINYFYSLVYGALYSLNNLVFEESAIESYSVKYDSSITFSFNQFSLIKKIAVSYKVNDESHKSTYEFDKKDRLSKVTFDDDSIYLKIDYKLTNISFPDFSEYK